jgi:hypothetical protein
MNHWALFKQSWSILWRHKTLWVFGLLAALGGGGFNFNWNVGQMRPIAELPIGLRSVLSDFFSSGALVTFTIIALAIGVVVFVLATFAQAALIRMISDIRDGQSPSVGDGMQAATQRFVPLLAVRFLLALPILILGIIASGSFITAFAGNFGPNSERLFNFGDLSTAIGLGGILFVLGLLLSAIGVSAERAIVLEDIGIWPAIVRGWNLLWKKFADYFSIALIFVVLAIVLGLAFACVLIPVILTSILPSLGQQLGSGINPAIIVLNIVGPVAIVALVLGLIVGSLVAIFTSSVWTLAFREWQSQEQVPVASSLS